ncbi:hypothetical protein CYMTET_26953 [Cymbomonas tetramitiformis]|uniref:Uncharacterized protein n=1 Tax=Cymbomonas tetramitiformis TaxID=36881 RepID=A0AAE0FQR9_9CHLO|nr:hypothetical protein CYMTET_26953 [Cymbomonas tetramitiformis]
MHLTSTTDEGTNPMAAIVPYEGEPAAPEVSVGGAAEQSGDAPEPTPEPVPQPVAEPLPEPVLEVVTEPVPGSTSATSKLEDTPPVPVPGLSKGSEGPPGGAPGGEEAAQNASGSGVKKSPRLSREEAAESASGSGVKKSPRVSRRRRSVSELTPKQPRVLASDKESSLEASRLPPVVDSAPLFEPPAAAAATDTADTSPRQADTFPQRADTSPRRADASTRQADASTAVTRAQSRRSRRASNAGSLAGDAKSGAPTSSDLSTVGESVSNIDSPRGPQSGAGESVSPTENVKDNKRGRRRTSICKVKAGTAKEELLATAANLGTSKAAKTKNYRNRQMDFEPMPFKVDLPGQGKDMGQFLDDIIAGKPPVHAGIM